LSDFIFQDRNIVSNEALYRHGSFQLDWFPRRRILIWLTYWLDMRAFGMNADGWRRSSMLLHIFTAMLLIPVSIPAAVLIAVHPLTLMASSYIAGRSGLLSGMVQLLIGLLCIGGIFVPAILLAVVASLWVKEDSLIFFPMIGVLWLMR